MIRRPPRSTQSRSSAASDVYKRQAGLIPVLLLQSLALSPPSIAVRNNANVLRESTKALHYGLLRMPATGRPAAPGPARVTPHGIPLSDRSTVGETFGVTSLDRITAVSYTH